jgi:hypothetical protein
VLELDADKSRIRIRTYAEGMFARLAHDLELVCDGLRGTSDAHRATLEVDVGRIAVAGVLRGESVDPRGISENDKKDCLAKMRREVFPAGDLVRVEATLDGARAAVVVRMPDGRSTTTTIPVEVDGHRVKGSLALSLSKLGAPVVKGPMSAFRVRDTVEILFDVSFATAV